ncbi:MAG: acyl-CoA thioesterase [Gammaproteobacteria bacterium]|nr:acyl-CoA thioesterase [Gammaproteobacteria bacterium]
MDAMNHVNNVKYFRYLETARINFLHQVFPEFADAKMDESAHGLALGEARCRFKVPLTYPDELIIGSAIRDISESGFLVQHEIYSQKLDRIAAEGDGRMVYYDFAGKQRAIIPRKFRKLLETYSMP